MKSFHSVDEILDFAINAEQEAIDFYTSLANKQNSLQLKEMLLEFAGEEINHKAKLTQIKQDGIFDLDVSEEIPDLKISDYIVSVKPSNEMDYADALVLAMKKEKAAFKLYTALSERTSSKELKKVFRALAVEESRHKLRFEIEYDEYVMREN